MYEATELSCRVQIKNTIKTRIYSMVHANTGQELKASHMLFTVRHTE